MGFSSTDRCDHVHRKYLKWLLGVKINTKSMAVYGETGRSPLFIDRYIRSVKYWLKLANSEHNNYSDKAIYNHLLDEQDEKENCQNWVSNVKSLLQRVGFYDVWMYPHSVNANVFLPIL